MTTNKTHFLHNLLKTALGCMVVLCVAFDANGASVTSRGAKRATTTAARNQVKTTAPVKQDNTAKTTTKTESEPEPEPEIIVENKSSQFDDILSEAKEIEDISADNDLAEKIRKQRAAFNAQSAQDVATTNAKTALSTGKNDCDQKLRACMKTKCGDDFTKCAGDTDTIWGDKLDLCRQKITCTGTEYNLFTTEIKADRDLNAKLSQYKSIVDCGNKYNNCIITQCGKTFTNCLGKSAGDAAIAKCKSIATECKEQDSGLPARAMSVMGTLRENAEELVARDEQRLYDLRDQMRSTCERLGAMFDERTLDCVYTINFYGGENGDLMASKKAYAGSSFNCDANWFGIDVTTFMENAFRLTRSQKSASAAAMGGGIGMGVGAVTSGAIDRAIDTHKAKKELKAAEKEATAHEETQENTTENNNLSAAQGGEQQSHQQQNQQQNQQSDQQQNQQSDQQQSQQSDQQQSQQSD